MVLVHELTISRLGGTKFILPCFLITIVGFLYTGALGSSRGSYSISITSELIVLISLTFSYICFVGSLDVVGTTVVLFFTITLCLCNTEEDFDCSLMDCCSSCPEAEEDFDCSSRLEAEDNASCRMENGKLPPFGSQPMGRGFANPSPMAGGGGVIEPVRIRDHQPLGILRLVTLQ